jgi:ABC-type transporter Mla subunit MlaD
MSDNTFRLVITAAVALNCIAFLVLAIVAMAFYRTVRKMQVKVEELSDDVVPLMAQATPLIRKVGPVIDKMGPVIERFGPMMDQAGHSLERLGPVLDKAVGVIGQIGVVVQQAGPVVESARLVLNNTNQVITDSRPRIVEFSDEAVGAARTAREQVERIGNLVHDVSNRAHARLEQIDHSVESTVEQVGQVGDAMKRAVLRPVREANGIAAGISAAVSTLVRPRKSSPEAATQDEEMFI